MNTLKIIAGSSFGIGLLIITVTIASMYQDNNEHHIKELIPLFAIFGILVVALFNLCYF